MDSLTYWKRVAGDNYPYIKKTSTMTEFVEHINKEFSNDIAISWLGNSKTYHDLYIDIAKTRKLFVDKGIKKGDNVALIFKNDYNYVKCFFALTTLGAVAVLIPPALPMEALLGSFKKFDTFKIVYCECIEENISKIKTSNPNFVFISSKELDNLVGSADANKDILPTDAAAIMFTGGTTGKPKGAVLSHQALLRGAYNGSIKEGKIFKIKYMVLIPLFHVFGLVRSFLSGLNTGSNLYLVKDMMQFPKEIKAAQPEIMVLVPALANLIYSLIYQYGYDFVGGKLDTIICGGAFVTPDLIKRLSSVNISACPGYGLTETANMTCGNVNIIDKAGSVGIIYPEQDVKIINGEICIKGDNLLTCYYKDEEETKNSFTSDGYFKTGDLGHFDEDNFLYIDGRCKNIFVLDSGEKVSPEILENALDSIPLINSSLIYEERNDDGRIIVAVKIFPNYPIIQKMGYTDVDKTINGLVNEVNNKFPRYMRISKVTILKEDLKRSGSMKIIRSANI